MGTLGAEDTETNEIAETLPPSWLCSKVGKGMQGKKSTGKQAKNEAIKL